MSAGLIIRNEAGDVLLDATKNIGKVFGYFDTGTRNGSITVTLPFPGTVFYIQTPLSGNGASGKLAGVVNTGPAFSWVFSYPPGRGFYSANSRVYYGVY